MRILSVATLVTPTGDYGGPLRVAVNQATALRQRGHAVTLVAGHRGFDATPPVELAQVPARLFATRRLVPVPGFAGLGAPGMLRFVLERADDFDIAHVHVARDLVTLPAAALIRRKGVPFVLQPHGMIDSSARLLTKLGDPLLTRPVLAGAARIFYLTDREREELAALTGADRLEHLPNGVPTTDYRADPTAAEVLYLARLAPRKRPALFVAMADALADRYPAHRFTLVGPDEGELGAVRAAIQRTRADVEWEGSLDPNQTLARMARAGIFVLPAVDEPYPMAVLEAMSVGLPVVITDSCGLAPVVRQAACGIVTDDRVESLVAAVERLIADPELACRMGAAGRAAASHKLGMPAIADRLERSYGAVVGGIDEEDRGRR